MVLLYFYAGSYILRQCGSAATESLLYGLAVLKV
ncbi:hypothetical protein BMS3Abin10_00990 [bacterium BMS3Abin10]|nr:hypothetical protein BMS3Abin10_00990 [bacterium BMS3Abin10]GBE39219.1 hypothetical protein BMS3Bbin08_01840 [bacterium BMS3Bbin08]